MYQNLHLRQLQSRVELSVENFNKWVKVLKYFLEQLQQEVEGDFTSLILETKHNQSSDYQGGRNGPVKAKTDQSQF